MLCLCLNLFKVRKTKVDRWLGFRWERLSTTTSKDNCSTLILGTGFVPSLSAVLWKDCTPRDTPCPTAKISGGYRVGSLRVDWIIFCPDRPWEDVVWVKSVLFAFFALLPATLQILRDLRCSKWFVIYTCFYYVLLFLSILNHQKLFHTN